MKKDIIRNIRFLIISFLFLGGALALAFGGPSASAPGNNTPKPIDSSTVPQAKGGVPAPAGSLLHVEGTTSSTVFFAWNNATINNDLSVGSLKGTGTRPVCVDSSHKLVICTGTVAGPMCGDGIVNAAEDCDDGNTTSGDGCSSSCMLEGGSGGGIIGHVFVTGPHNHGGISGRKVVYVGQSIHPAFTVRVKNFGRLADTYMNTSNPAPPDSDDGIYYIPAGTSSSPTIQYSTSCSGSGCTVGTGGANYGVAYQTSLSSVDTYIPSTYHVCKYPDAPGVGQYFSPARFSSGSVQNDTCQTNYPDAEVIY